VFYKKKTTLHTGVIFTIHERSLCTKTNSLLSILCTLFIYIKVVRLELEIIPEQPVSGSPINPGGQVHLKLPSKLEQRAFRPHGFRAHSFKSRQPVVYGSPS